MTRRDAPTAMFGILHVNKPVGRTSRDVVNIVQRQARPAKVGHAGTLDPLADGVLVICVGKATRLIELVQRGRKAYRAEFRLGCFSPSDDSETEIQPFPDCTRPTSQDLEAALPQFLGVIQQTPPTYSAIKVEGRRAYALARQGAEVRLAPRPVEIHALMMEEYAYPKLVLNIACGSGVYVRSLGRDIAAAVGSRAVMTGLTRTRVGRFALNDAATTSDLERDGIGAWIQPALHGVAELPRVTLDDGEVDALRRAVMLPNRWGVEGAEIAAIDPSGELVAILKPKQSLLRPWRNFVGEG